MGAARPRNLIFDAGALVALEKGDQKIRALLALAVRHDARIVIPAGVVAQVWRDGARQARLARFLASPSVTIDVLDSQSARACGILCGKSKTSDVVEASLLVSAARHGGVIVTSDPKDLRRLAGKPQLPWNRDGRAWVGYEARTRGLPR